MPSKKKIIYVVSGGVFATILLVTLLFLGDAQDGTNSPHRQVGDEKALDPDLKPYQAEIEEIKELAKTDQKAAAKREKELRAKLPEAYRRYFAVGFEAGMLPTNFYGKIVDQYGAPVANTPIGFSLEGALLASGQGIGSVQTDADGRFEIHGKGGALTLTGITHPNVQLYYPPPHTRYTMHEPRNRTIRILPNQETVGGKNLLWTETSPEKPHVFTAWRVDKYESVEVGHINSYQEIDGRVHAYDLKRKDEFGRPIPHLEAGVEGGQLRISCSRHRKKNQFDQLDWTVTITPVDGGIQRTDDYYLNLAPESGYEPSLTITQHRASPDYKDKLVNQRFYFMAKNGQVYGSLFMNIYPQIKRDKCRFDIRQFKANFNASRNLVVK